MKKNPSILIVDDDKALLKILKVNLSLEGYDVVTASDGKSALSLLEEYEPQLIVLDVVMPGIDGFQVLNQVRRNSKVPIIMLTAKDEAVLASLCLCKGADDYVRKPFDMLELTARIRSKLRRYHRQFKVESPALAFMN